MRSKALQNLLPTASPICGRLLIVVLLLVAKLAYSAEQDWKADVEKMLTEFLACREPVDDKSPCNVFTARSLKRIYGITDFDSSGRTTPYLTANEIATFVSVKAELWTRLGSATDQSALSSAQGYANRKKAIIAVMTGIPHGHVAVILPGELQMSGSWKLKVPNSASFFLNKPEKAYVGKPLSNAFTAEDAKNVVLYGRNF